MPTVIKFRVFGEPKGQPRPRAFSRGGHARMYDPGTAEGWKGCIALAARDLIPPSPIQGPVELDLLFFMPRPQTLSRRKDPRGDLPCTAKPDIDNLAKAVMDAITALGIWQDDKLVTATYFEKRYHEIGGRPGCFVEIREVTL